VSAVESEKRKTDVLILGGGVIGLACAYYLLRAGRSVRVIDKGLAGAATSHGNCGTITPSHAMPLAMPGVIVQALRWMFQADAPLRIAPRLDFALIEWLLQFAHRCTWSDFRRTTAAKAPLLMLARQALEEVVREAKLDCEFATNGTLAVYRDAKAFDNSEWLPRALTEVGLPVEMLDGSACRALEPALNDSIVAGYKYPSDASLRPEKYLSELVRVVRELGGDICESTTIQGFRTDGARVASVATDRGEFTADNVVLALGAWSSLIGRQLDLRIPIQPGKGYSITYTRPRLSPRIPITLKERSVCVTAWESGFRLGSTMEFAGYDTSLNRTRLDALRRGAAEYLIEPEGPHVVEEWYGWRPMTYDDLPLLGRASRLHNLFLATGHGMLGVTMSAVTGMLISEMICDKPLSLDAKPYAPSRFMI
jgi:D-amino-acid dehydrogenase